MDKKDTCHNDYRLYQKTNQYKPETAENFDANLTTTKCSTFCDNEPSCKYFFIATNGHYCQGYSLCDKRRKPYKGGTTFEKVQGLVKTILYQPYLNINNNISLRLMLNKISV